MARETLSKIYETAGDLHAATQVLIQIPLEGSSRNISDDYKSKTLVLFSFQATLVLRLGSFLQIAHLLFKSGDISTAESYLNRASAGLAVTERDDLKYQFKVLLSNLISTFI